MYRLELEYTLYFIFDFGIMDDRTLALTMRSKHLFRGGMWSAGAFIAYAIGNRCFTVFTALDAVHEGLGEFATKIGHHAARSSGDERRKVWQFGAAGTVVATVAITGFMLFRSFRSFRVAHDHHVRLIVMDAFKK